jgi:hypothetical protein
MTLQVDEMTDHLHDSFFCCFHPPNLQEVSEAECCAVCIEPYKASDVVRLLPCRHEFHKVCVDPWLLEHRTCPMCKMDILKHYGYVVRRSSLYDGRKACGISPEHNPLERLNSDCSLVKSFKTMNCLTVYG